MCMQDLFIALHTTKNYLGDAASFTIPANVNRYGLIITRNGGWDLADQAVRYIYSVRHPNVPTNFTTTDTNEVPPTDNTGTITQSASNASWLTHVVTIKDVGTLIQGQLILGVAVGTATVWELVADAVLQKMLNDMELAAGWPLYGLPSGR